MDKKILIIEDDLDIHFLLTKMLMKEGYQIQSAYSGQDALALIEANSYDVILLDLMLPGISGEELLHIARQKDETPIMILSAKTHVDDRVAALKQGADDYLTKPFFKEEVLARVAALIRRSTQKESKERKLLTHKNLQLDLNRHCCVLNNEPLNLTNTQFKLLETLLKAPEKVFSKGELFALIWSDTYDGFENAMNVHISNLRKKLKEVDSKEEYIETVWGIGFKLSD